MQDLKKDIEIALLRYPDLKLQSGYKIITGEFKAYEKITGTYIETYNLEIKFPYDYPYRFPSVIETSKKIPRVDSRHVNSDGTLCFANLPDEYRYCKRGITLIQFFDQILNPHLCREFFREKEGYYPNGERAHGTDGNWETYYEIFNTKDKEQILKELDLIINSKKKPERNDPCYCNSGKKYKKCHYKIEDQVLDIGLNKVIKIVDELKIDWKKQNIVKH